MTPRAERTQAAIYDAAMSLFEERGYEHATMRAIAERAGVSLGSSYHYFPSKGHLVIEFYRRLVRKHRAAIGPLLATERDLEARVRGTLHALVDCCERVRSAAGSIASVAADPRSPANPFAPASASLREEGVDLYRAVVGGARDAIPPDLRGELPALLWTAQMAVVYLWMTDRSEARRDTLAVVDEATALLVRGLALARLPLMRDSRERALRLLRTITAQLAPNPDSERR
jgi:AcrR family transcriptional regulator